MKELVCIKPFTTFDKGFKLQPPQVGKTYNLLGPSKVPDSIMLVEYGYDWGFDEDHFAPKNSAKDELLKEVKTIEYV